MPFASQFCANLVDLAWTGDDFSRGKARGWYTHTKSDQYSPSYIEEDMRAPMANDQASVQLGPKRFRMAFESWNRPGSLLDMSRTNLVPLGFSSWAQGVPCRDPYTLLRVVPMSFTIFPVNPVETFFPKIEENLNFDRIWPYSGSNGGQKYGAVACILHTALAK